MKMADQCEIKRLLIFLIKHQEKGSILPPLFLLILTVLVIIAVILPCTLSQVGKSREAEGRKAMTITMGSQQAFHAKKQIFATQIAELKLMLPAEYYSYTMESSPNSVFVQGIPNNSQKDGIRSFSSGLIFDQKTQQYSGVICQSNVIVEKIPKPVFTDGKLHCPEMSTIIEVIGAY